MKYVLLSFLLLSISACNLDQNVAIRGLDLHTHEANDLTYVDLEAIVSIGNLKLSNTTSPIQNAEHKEIGDISVQHLDDGSSRISVTVLYDEAMKMDSDWAKHFQMVVKYPLF